VADVLGVAAGDVHGQSFADVLEDATATGARDYIYTEIFSPLGSTAPGRVFDERRIGCSLRLASGERYKVVRDQELGADRLYRLEDENGDLADAWELDSLDYSQDGAERDAYLAIVAKIAAIEASGASTGGTGCGNVTSFCPGLPNSGGGAAKISTAGSRSLCANTLDFLVEGLPGSQAGLFFCSPGNQPPAPFGHGALCLSSTGLIRLPVVVSNPQGKLTYNLDMTGQPYAPLATWHFQLWYRDPPAGGPGFNLSNALRILFCN
jgi:hypothetical protein